MIKFNIKALLKALSSLFIPTVSICLFVFFLVLDLQKLINIVFGSAWYSIVLRLLIIIIEASLFWYIYSYYVKKESLSYINNIIKNPKDFSDDIHFKHSMSIKKDKWNDLNVSGSTTDLLKFFVSAEKTAQVKLYEIDTINKFDVNIDNTENLNVDVNINTGSTKYYLITSEEQ